ncbi:hypothetical protein [Oleidesulfovibrio alaskensis]|jgi:dnd system-associated protein 4|uniref:hypothetical protein n=1 Tax=Oleidesulfovibrio alaskensis TaxID=58180 RepID=UPI001A548A0D|nr:hypothetical protein [Oleidesulfovibrio alaskensis]MBL3580830.1 hypothetical protein [Oleidesulfovibrio alaskensis]MBL3587907.1 hypothetical protein [bacterium]
MRAIKRRKEYEKIVRLLSERQKEAGQRSVLGSMREVQVFAALLGFDNSRLGTVEGDTMEIDSRIFDNSETAMNTIDLIALASSGDLGILDEEREEERISIFEKFADGGFQILTEWFQACPSDSYGDQAIVSGMKKAGYLIDDAPKAPDEVLSDVVF